MKEIYYPLKSEINLYDPSLYSYIEEDEINNMIEDVGPKNLKTFGNPSTRDSLPVKLKKNEYFGSQNDGAKYEGRGLAFYVAVFIIAVLVGFIFFKFGKCGKNNMSVENMNTNSLPNIDREYSFVYNSV